VIVRVDKAGLNEFHLEAIRLVSLDDRTQVSLAETFFWQVAKLGWIHDRTVSAWRFHERLEAV
jgi:hypothetical protein